MATTTKTSTVFTSVKGFHPTKDTTEGAILIDILGAVDPETGEEGPIISKNGNPMYILVFDDGCRYPITLGAINYLLSPTTIDGDENDDYLHDGIIPGMKLSATREDNGRPVIKYVD